MNSILISHFGFFCGKHFKLCLDSLKNFRDLLHHQKREQVDESQFLAFGLTTVVAWTNQKKIVIALKINFPNCDLKANLKWLISPKSLALSCTDSPKPRLHLFYFFRWKSTTNWYLNPWYGALVGGSFVWNAINKCFISVNLFLISTYVFNRATY